ncbi:MAG: hypothetical protein ACXWPI_18345 [Ktedonobacterales bacterium]
MAGEVHGQLATERIDIGDGHTLRAIVWPGDEHPSGWEVFHPSKKEPGKECGCGVWVARRIGQMWTLESWEPLTISPSVLCLQCGDHGFIRNGRWVSA